MAASRPERFRFASAFARSYPDGPMRDCVLIAAACTVLALPAAASAAPRPDLQVRAVSSPSSQEAPGSRMSASATVRNAGDRTAPPSRVGFYLSRDRRKSSGDFLLRPRPRLRARGPRTRARLLRTFTVPTRITPGNYALIACADDTRRIRERRERNNCRSASRRIRIVPRAQVPLPGLITPVTPGTPGTTFTTPVLRVEGPPNGSVTSDATPGYTGTAQSSTAAVARVEAKVDAGAFSTLGVSCSGCGTRAVSWTFTPTAPLPNGPHAFSFRAIDVNGRSSPTITFTVTVDTTAPTFVSITATPGSNSVAATFSEPLACTTVNSFDFSAEINGSAVAVTGVNCSASSATITLALGSAPAAGATVEVTLSGIVSDQAGNVAPRPTTRSDAA